MARPSPQPGTNPLPQAPLEAPPLPAARWQIHWSGNTIELPREGVLIIGRSPRCDVVIENTQVSRTHCRLEVSKTGVVVEDLRSSNGLYVNGDRVRGTRQLRSGDRLLLGTEELVVRASGHAALPEPPAQPLTPEHSVALTTEGPAVWRRKPQRSDPQIITTQKADAFETLGRLADRMLASGRYEAAVKILSGHMKAILGAIREGNVPPDEVIAGSTRYAVKLAAERREGSWIDYVLDLHLALRRPLALDVVQQARNLLNEGVKVDRDLLTNYKEMLRSLVPESSPSDREKIEANLALESPL